MWKVIRYRKLLEATRRLLSLSDGCTCVAANAWTEKDKYSKRYEASQDDNEARKGKIEPSFTEPLTYFVLY